MDTKKWLVGFGSIILVAGLAYALKAFAFSWRQYIPILEEKPQETQNIAKNEALETFLDKLAECESQGNDYAKVLDTNSKYSYGRYQFQRQTWEMALAKYNLAPQAEPAEYINLIFDGELQRKAAELMLKEKDGWKHWTVCSKRIGVDKLAFN